MQISTNIANNLSIKSI